MQGFRSCGREEGAMETDEVCDRPLHPFAPCGTQAIRIEKSSHKTHLIQLMQQMRCVSYAQNATEKGRRTRRYTAP